MSLNVFMYIIFIELSIKRISKRYIDMYCFFQMFKANMSM